MADDETQRAKLQVANSRPEDSGRGLAHLPRSWMAKLALAEGDVIEIVGKRTTAARAIRPYGEDAGIDIIRLDGLQRANAGVGSADYVEVRKAASKAATRVVFAPAQPNIRLQGSSDALKRTFAGRAALVLATALAFVLLGEVPSALVLPGGAAVLFGIYLVTSAEPVGAFP